jgi:CCR4-NOT transcriptional regulation complex NOT5 subunit
VRPNCEYQSYKVIEYCCDLDSIQSHMDPVRSSSSSSNSSRSRKSLRTETDGKLHGIEIVDTSRALLNPHFNGYPSNWSGCTLEQGKLNEICTFDSIQSHMDPVRSSISSSSSRSRGSLRTETDDKDNGIEIIDTSRALLKPGRTLEQVKFKETTTTEKFLQLLNLTLDL